MKSKKVLKFNHSKTFYCVISKKCVITLTGVNGSLNNWLYEGRGLGNPTKGSSSIEIRKGFGKTEQPTLEYHQTSYFTLIKKVDRTASFTIICHSDFTIEFKIEFLRNIPIFK